MKLTDRDVIVARQIHSELCITKYALIKLLAREFGVTAHYMGRVLNGNAR